LGFPVEKPKPLAVGETVPDFELTDQTGAQVRLSAFRGHAVAINFIYTRCPLPDVCPRLSANFARLARRFGPRVILLSLTIDPGNDTPEVLARYATLWKANPENWHFLTGDPAVIRSVASSFGMLYFAEEGSLSHTSATAVIGTGGRLAGIVEGSGYAVSQLGDLIAREMEALR
jgi:protein SCO1/2